MEQYDKRVDEYIDKAADFARPILIHFRELMHRASPLISETIKWGVPHFDYKGTVCTLAAFKNHCAIGFWKASLIDDPHGILKQDKRGEAAGQFGKITGLNDLPADEVLLAIIKSAITINEKGIKPVVKKEAKPKTELVIPGYFMELLDQNPAAREHFNRFSNSSKKEYVAWFNEARTEATLQKRLQTALEQISEGKARHWKYQR